ncbi:MAG: thiolase family protein [Ruminococcaceae bacterium]|nr:thiolase family protein [Oscillospiraceae bacterium]
MKEREVVIVDGCRTAFGKRGGGLKSFSAAELGGLCVKALLERTGIEQRGKVDSLVAGMCIDDTVSQSTASYISQLGGLPFDVSSMLVEMQCGSAITALNHAAWRIKMGISDVAVVGGVESHSNVPGVFSTDFTPYRGAAPVAMKRTLTPNSERATSMIQNSDKMAARWGVTREACDEFSIRSQQRIQAAYRSGLIGPEIIPVEVPATESTPGFVVDKDEHPRPDVTLEKIAAMKPIFPGGVTTAANASGTNDGAAFLLVMTAEKAREFGYEPYARWIGCAHAGIQEDYMGVAASYSHLKAAKQLGLKMKDFDVFESNEAFAAQQLAVIKDIEAATGEKIDQSRWNPNGGAIALGHPNAASGARIAIFAMRQLEKTGGRYASVSSCCGGGQGTTAILENLRR